MFHISSFTNYTKKTARFLTGLQYDTNNQELSYIAAATSDHAEEA